MQSVIAWKSAKPNAGAMSEAVTKAFARLFDLRDTDATELILVRHAEPDYRAGGENKDRFDPPLTEKGRFQALRLAMRLRRMAIEAVYTSTMRQALETAVFIAAAKDLPIIRMHQIREVSFDSNTQNGADSDKQAAQVAIRLLNKPRWDALPGFEPSERFRQRVIQAIEGILAHHPGQRVVVVTHGGVINIYLSMLLDIPRDMFFMPEYASISVVRSLQNLTTMHSLNDFAHLLPMFNPR